MVVAAPAAASTASAASSVHKNTSVVHRSGDLPRNEPRRPLTSSEKDNAAVSRRPRTKEITSRYLSSYSSSSSSTTSTSYSSNTTTSSSTSASSSSRRFPSPLSNQRPSTPSALANGSAAKRSQSVDRSRPSTPRADPRGGGGAAARALCTTTRSLSVSFQGESFFYQTSKTKNASPVSARKLTPERRRPSTPARSSNIGLADKCENSRPSDHYHRWPAARSRQSNFLRKSLDYPSDKDFLANVQLLRKSVFCDAGTGRVSLDGADLFASSDTESVSSGSNSGIAELSVPLGPRVTPRDFTVPAKFWQETNGRLRCLPDRATPLLLSGTRSSATSKLAPLRPSLVDSLTQSPRSSSPALRRPVRPSSPSNLVGSPSRGLGSSSLPRGNGALAVSSPCGLPATAPSIISFAAEVRRSKKGENRIEEAHLLRLFHNRHLQWRCVNARANAALMVQRVVAEKNMYSAWITISELHDSVMKKKIKLHFLKKYLKLCTILKGQMIFLEEWYLLEKEHSSSLSGSTEALKASTLRLPVIIGAKIDFQEMKDAIVSAVDVMQAMGVSICTCLSKVEGTSSLASELIKVTEQEQALLDQSRDLLSTLAALHVKQSSLLGHLLQLKRTVERSPSQSP
ncbi:hypothetical protein AXF42_Ash004330 [Apostasia shenzhenica]|uniref:QWRF motif-containing protein 2 n=1 Tax=Apostasia shenzhenica TaxID=1088818 RepID=A0A2I0A2L5_9ASPA|nr:hypothetical protein AXF42_Ash004330 [Apostasia shenzhenica]